MKRVISERHIVVILFVVVFITFSFAQEDTKELEKLYSGLKPLPAAEFSASRTSIPVVLEKKEDKKNIEDDLNLH